MNIKNLKQFRELLIKNKIVVSGLECTKNNYDNDGSLIKDDLPTITTDFCEIGLHNGEIYFVFIIDSKTFSQSFFDKIKNKANVKIYGFKDFNKTLYPVNNFNFDNFLEQIQKDKYLQIQLDYKNIDEFYLFKEYSDLVRVFENSGIVVVNQLKTDSS
ncbi:hypothetical protein HQ571_03645 [Candidatus Kuenenbacteria bacterium]|nr:hypothetical protein [Candidatus Kuenenbacteria bacterium]